MKIAYLVDPIEKMNPKKDTSYCLILASLKLGHRPFVFYQDSLSFHKNCIKADLGHITGIDAEGALICSSWEKINLTEMQAIFVRKDPPFDRRYLYSMQLLDLVGGETRVVNSPAGIRDWNEKLAALHFAQFAPDTLISQKATDILSFCQAYKKVVLKPLDGFGGKGIHIVNTNSGDLHQLISELTKGETEKIVVNNFISEAKQGDKRILILNGEPLGAILRVAAEGRELNNLDQGGKAVASDLTAFDIELCKKLKPELLKRNLFFVGIDLLGQTLTEINVTSPTGLQELIRFSGHAFDEQIIKNLLACRT